MIRIQSGKDMPPALTEQAEPGQPTRPGLEETPLARAERQITRIKVTPAPWDVKEWDRLPESDKSFRLARKVDWRDIHPEDKRRLLEREVDFTRVSPADQQWHLGQVLHDDGNYEGRRNQRVLDQIEKVSQLPRWPAMSHGERAAALERHVQWDGFDAGDRFDVIENVLHGKDRSGWLDSIKPLAEKTAREDAMWEEAARRGNGSPNSEPYIRREWISFAQDVIDTLKRTEDFVRIDRGQVVSEWLDRPEGDFTRLGGWNRLEQRDKLAAVMSSNATEMLGADDIRALLRREIDFTRVPRDVQRRWLGEVYHDAPAAPDPAHRAQFQQIRDPAKGTER